MHRADNSRYFLFIEPDPAKKSTTPVDDELTTSLQAALAQATPGTSAYTDVKDKGTSSFNADAGYRGMHFAADGQVSDTHDYLLPNGFISNSLAVHYARFYRDDLPRTELTKLKDLHTYMQQQQQKQQTKDDL